ncbi:MAG: acyl-CoA dehydrogenase family protein [Acidimicrobiia bacterium]|nr:acyl-CoA dehydrogenase family protein [Acidimicrobiia bacterium]
MLDGSEVWCQLWSEPDAGSDVASLETRAERDGDGWTLHGQKVWTTGAQHCRWGLAIARTDPDVPKHRGITCFVVDMLDPGVTVRPLRQMTGGAHFNEVFLDGARVPDEHVVGDVGGGWHVAMATLANERYSVGGLLTTGFSAEPVLALAGEWAGGRPARDPVLRQELARIYTAWRLLALTNARSLSALARGSVPGPEGSTIKLAWARLSTALADVAVRVLGPAAGIVGEDAPEPGHWTTALLYAPANHIAGGTDEIQKTIIGERVLGLPREPAVDRDVPFRELKAASARR